MGRRFPGGDGGGGGTSTVSNIIDNREFKHWQDFFFQTYNGDGTSTDNYTITQASRVVTDGGSAIDRGITSAATWTVPTGVTKIRLTCIGGGGGGGRAGGLYYGGDGGGGGGYASAEYTVTPGEALTINCGAGGGGRWDGGTANTGGTTSITDNNTGGVNINIQAGGGAGGFAYASGSNTGGGGSVSGSNVVGGTSITTNGGQGGYGSSSALSFGPEGYGAGGGGSAGSFLGNGHIGGSATYGGYSYSSAGGAGIGGHGGYADASRTADVYEHRSGSGGGSAGPGTGGGYGYTNAPYSFFEEDSQGGPGLASAPFIGDFVDSHYSVSGLGAIPDNQEGTKACWLRLKGARYGDGEATAPEGDAQGNFDGINANATKYTAASDRFLVLPAKSFNGVLGRLWGGGGAGNFHKNLTYGTYCRSGGDGGSGAGGGGSSSSTTTWNGSVNTYTTYSSWDPANMAWRTNDTAYNTTNWQLQGMGGHGGALGGGGGSSPAAYAGNGGIGGGGGGAGGHYNGATYLSRGGSGGPGYVLIEWE